jgi:hypothetical protein
MRGRTILAALLMAWALPVMPAQAEAIDTAGLKCFEVADGTRPQPEVAALFSWMHGYIGGMRNDTFFDHVRYNADLDRLAEICRAGSERPVLEIFQELPHNPPGPETIDVAKLSCGDFASMGDEGTGIIRPWIDGYIGYIASDTVYDKQTITDYMVKAEESCAKDSTLNLLELVRAAAIEE